MSKGKMPIMPEGCLPTCGVNYTLYHDVECRNVAAPAAIDQNGHCSVLCEEDPCNVRPAEPAPTPSRCTHCQVKLQGSELLCHECYRAYTDATAIEVAEKAKALGGKTAEASALGTKQIHKCEIRHAMSSVGHVGYEHCLRPLHHDGDCLVEWMGQHYWCSQQGWEGHPPKPIKEMSEKPAI